MGHRPRIGLVGCGRWGKHILRDLVYLDCEVICVARSAESCERAVAGSASAIVHDVGELPAIDGAIVAVPTLAHGRVIDALLERRVPIFVEKPIAPRAAEAWRLARLAPDRLFVMDKWRYHPGVEMLGSIARGGELGPVLGLRTLRVGWGHAHDDVDSVWILAPHELAIALEILGEVPEPRAAVGERTGDGLTHLVGMLGFGASGWMALEVSARRAAWRREVHLHCEAGVATLDDAYAEHVSIVHGDGTGPSNQTELRRIDTELPLLRELQAFVRHVRKEGPPPRSSAEEGARIVSAVSALRAFAGFTE